MVFVNVCLGVIVVLLLGILWKDFGILLELRFLLRDILVELVELNKAHKANKLDKQKPSDPE